MKKAFSVLDSPMAQEEAQVLAKELKGKIPLVYSSERLYCVAYKWKISFNENAKIHAFCNTFPEFNHNEINGFVHPDFPYHALFLEDEDDHPAIKKRMLVVKRIIEEHGSPVTHLKAGGDSLLARMMWTIYLGDYVSYYLALAYGRDPTPVPMIEQLKILLKR